MTKFLFVLLVIAAQVAVIGYRLAPNSRVIEQDSHGRVSFPSVATSPPVEVAGSRLAQHVSDRSRLAPVSLTAPTIGLDYEPISPVGSDATNTMELKLEGLSWYSATGPPLADGSTTLLTSHVAFDGVNGALAHLDSIAVGDELILELEDGSTVVYDVTSKSTHAKSTLKRLNDLDPSDDNETYLHLLTCGGAFDPNARSYNSYVLVSALARS